MPACLFLLAAGAAALIFYLCEKVRRYSLKAVFLKTLVSVLFIAVALCGLVAAAPTGRAAVMGAFVSLGLLFGLLGDIWLDLKYVFPKDDAVFTYAGFASFGVGHILYISGPLLRYPPWDAPLYVAVPLLCAVLVTGVMLLLEKPMKLHYGRMKPVAAAYAFLLFLMVFIAAGLALKTGRSERTLNLFAIGGALFAVSDLILSGTYFGQGKDRPADLICNYLFYYGGQYMIAYSLLFLR